MKAAGEFCCLINDNDSVLNALNSLAYEMSMGHNQLRLDGRERSEIIIKFPSTASLFYCRARVDDDTFIFPKN